MKLVLKSAVEKVIDILIWHPVELAELMNSLVGICWGLWMITFRAADHSTAYQLLSSIAPEWMWGALLLTIGSFQLGLLLYGSLGPRRNIAGVACLMWIFLSALFGLSNFRILAVPTTAVYAVACGFVYLRLGVLGRASA